MNCSLYQQTSFLHERLCILHVEYDRVVTLSLSVSVCVCKNVYVLVVLTVRNISCLVVSCICRSIV